MKKVLAHIFEIGCSGLIGVVLTIGYQHFIAPPQSFTFFYNGEEIVATEYTYTELVENNEALNNELANLRAQIEQQNSTEEAIKIIQEATYYGNTSDYVQALSILNSVDNKTHEMDILINDYSIKYELYIIEQANIFKSNNKLDEAETLIKDALNVLPNSKVLKEKQQEIENSYPKNMLDVVPAYQCGGNKYTEYISSKSGATEYFTMGGVKYTNGMTFDADINIFNDVSWAIYNLNSEYNTLEFTVCHVDGTDNGNESLLQIFFDGNLKEEILLAPDMSPKVISLNVSGVTQLKIQIPSSGSANPLYGLGNPTIK